MMACSMNSVKRALLVFNIIFCVLALVIVVIGAVVMSNINEYKHFLEGKIVILPIVLILIGVVIFIFSLLGSYATLKKKHKILIMFASALSFVFILELIVIIVAITFKSDFDMHMRESLKDSMMKYSDSENDKMAWDTVQTKFNCCGIDASTDWQQNDTNNFARGLPPSCCKINTGNSCANSQYEANQDGCFSQLSQKVKKNSNLLIGASLSFAFVEICGIILAFLYARQIKKGNGAM